MRPKFKSQIVIWKHGKGTHCTNMGADCSAQNTPNAPEFICPICLLKPKSSRFQWKNALFGVRNPWYVVYTSIQVTGLFTESGWVNTKIGLWRFGLCLPVMYILQFSDVLTILNSHLNFVSHRLEYQNKYLRYRKTKSKSTFKRPKSYRGHVNRRKLRCV